MRSILGKTYQRVNLFGIAFVLAVSNLSVVAPVLFPTQAAALAGSICVSSDCSYTDLQTAVTAANPGETIDLGAGTYDLASQLNITKPLSIVGTGVVVVESSNSGWSTSNGSKHLVDITAGIPSNAVSITNVAFDSMGHSYGVNTYADAYGILNDVTIMNSKGAGLTVNGSTIKATHLNTSGNVWGAVNVDPGSGVTTPSVFTFNGGTLAESNKIWSDGSNVRGTATVAVDATSAGYTPYLLSDTGYNIWTNNLVNVATLVHGSTSTYYSTIQAAVNDAVSGDIINVAPGTYSENVNVTAGVDIRGSNYQVNPNATARGAEAILTNSSSGGRSFTISAGNTSVSINGFKFVGGSPIHDGNETHYPQTSDVTFNNNIVENSNNIFAGTNTSWRDVVVSNNKFNNVDGSATASALSIRDSLSATITNNTFTNINYAAILLDSIATATVSGNTIATTGAQAIQLANAMGNATVESNIITNANSIAKEADKGAIRLYGSDFTGAILIKNNTISGGYTGIAVKDGQSITGRNITVTKNSISGLDGGNGIYNGGTGLLNAMGNWWGSASGPFDNISTDGSVLATNPDANGSAATGAVKYDSWYTDADRTTLSSRYAITKDATGVTQTSATLNGTNGDYAASNTSFWWGTTSPAGPFTATTNASSQFNALTGWSHDSGLGAKSTGGSFGETITGLTPNTTYYFVAWSQVDGMWYPGAVKKLNFDTISPTTPTFVMKDANGNVVKNGYINTKYFTFYLKNPSTEGAVRYQLKYSNSFNSVKWNPTDLSATGHMATLGVYTDNFTQGEGTHSFAFSACDAVNNCSNFTTPLTVTYDKTSPVAYLEVTPVSTTGDFVHGSVVISGTTSSDTDHYYLVVKDHAGKIVYGPGTVPGATIHDLTWDTSSKDSLGNVNFADGTYTVDLEVRDKAGNKDAVLSVAKKTVIVDNTAPDVNVVSPTDVVTTGSVQPSVTATDINSPLTYSWSADSTNPAILSFNNAIAEPTFMPTVAGTYGFTLVTTDTLGNTTASHFGFTYAPLVVVEITPTANTVIPTPTANLVAVNTQAQPSADNLGTPAVLGTQAQANDGKTSDTTGTPEVKGASTQADQASGWALAWYWWLLIVAAAISFVWWLIARRRNLSEA